MGRLIDADKLLRHKTWINGPSGNSIYDVVFCDEIEEAPTVEAIPKADYENRLKADMSAMLDEFDLRLYEQYDDTDLIKVKYVRQAIQEKINSLKEEHDPTPQI